MLRYVVLHRYTKGPLITAQLEKWRTHIFSVHITYISHGARFTHRYPNTVTVLAEEMREETCLSNSASAGI